jgi:nucleotide-binding universal stress UspA family protein
MYDTVLVATDGSAPANRAVTHALEQAERHGATLHAVYVVDTGRHAEPALGSAELETHDVEAWGNAQLDEVRGRGESVGVAVETHCCHGMPSTAIVEYADRIDADLIVLGYQGQSHTRTNHIGSVTDRIVRNAGRPVLVV